ncbi:MAG: phosphotransferase [Anaerolineae bacterium]|uniref:phosphotransferase enzyme family protein n=1 Tax=Promineifilum sp. TaxID=2664178 RepID=UPI001DE71889|nr:phosphotransferase [Anaerolineales bacterium]MCB8935856.1 phosphotransferase [Promineifilum sp.]MCO5180477.1 phosphotransferase [Promineifilum sp.]MCW5848281.1 phosphotransferase [Anaerolineae bacterium]
MDPTIRHRYHDDILREAMRRYDIGPGEIEPGDGFESFIYRYNRAGERYILRITHTFRRTPELIHGEADWINYLAAGGATVARAIPSAGGKLVEEIDDGAGGRFLATAFAFAPGRPLSEAGRTPARLEAYGRLIGRMHALTKDYEPGKPAWRRHSWPADSVDEVERHLAAGDPAALERYRALLRWVAALPRGRDDYGLIHFDAHEGNFFVDGDTLILFDFDDCGYNWLANDIAMVVFYHVTNTADPAGAAATFLPPFLRGYRAENALNPAWAALIHNFMTLREIELYAIILRSYGITPDEVGAIPHAWTRGFMIGRRERIAAGQRYLDYDFDWK